MILRTLLGVLLLAPAALPQQPEAVEAASPWFGSSACFAGDVDADGRADLIVQHGPPGRGGTAWVLSGRARAVLHRFSGEREGRHLQLATGAGDVDGDGHADLLVAWARPGGWWEGDGRWELRSGKSGRLLRTFEASWVSPAVDLDDDDRVDLLLRKVDWEDGRDDYGVHRLVSSASGQVLWEVTASTREGHLGTGSELVGDVDGDGLPDIAGVQRRARTQELVVLSTRADEPLLRVPLGGSSCESFTLCDAGDLDADGKDDLAVGRTVHCTPHRLREAIRVYSGADGSVLLELTDEAIGYGPEDLDWDADFGSAIARVGDLDNDGVRDFLVAAESYSLGSGAFVLISAARREVLHVEPAPEHESSSCVHFASGLDTGADWDGDGSEDWLVTSGSITGGPGIGEVRIYSGATRALLERITPASIPD